MRVVSSGNDQADLVDAHAGARRARRRSSSSRRSASIRSRCALPHVTMPTFACGLGAIHLSMLLTRAKCAHGVELRGQTRFDRQARQVGPAVVQAARGREKSVGGAFHVGLACASRSTTVDARFDRLRDRLEADPRARKTRQRPAVQAELEHVRDVRRIHDRHAPAIIAMIALVRHRRRHAAVIVARHHQHAAVRRRAVGVAVLERIAGAVDARTLAVPHREHAFDGAFRVRLHPLRAEARRVPPSSSLIAGRKRMPRVVEQFLRLPQLLVDHAERRAAIAADEARRCSVRAAASRWRCISSSRTSACVPVRKTAPDRAQRLSESWYSGRWTGEGVANVFHSRIVIRQDGGIFSEMRPNRPYIGEFCSHKAP